MAKTKAKQLTKKELIDILDGIGLNGTDSDKIEQIEDAYEKLGKLQYMESSHKDLTPEEYEICRIIEDMGVQYQFNMDNNRVKVAELIALLRTNDITGPMHRAMFDSIDDYHGVIIAALIKKAGLKVAPAPSFRARLCGLFSGCRGNNTNTSKPHNTMQPGAKHTTDGTHKGGL